MGFRVLLIAVTGADPAVIQRDYGVEATGRFFDVPDSPVAGAQIPGGPYVLFINDEIVPDNALLARLSKGRSLITCHVNETVMCSSASGWVNGQEQWSVSHDSQLGIMHLEVTGQVPATFHEIRERLCSQQSSAVDVDYVFDIPVELFVAKGGVRYDHDLDGAGPNPWEELRRNKTPRRRFPSWPFSCL